MHLSFKLRVAPPSPLSSGETIYMSRNDITTTAEVAVCASTMRPYKYQRIKRLQKKLDLDALQTYVEILQLGQHQVDIDGRGESDEADARGDDVDRADDADKAGDVTAVALSKKKLTMIIMAQSTLSKLRMHGRTSSSLGQQVSPRVSLMYEDILVTDWSPIPAFSREPSLAHDRSGRGGSGERASETRVARARDTFNYGLSEQRA